MSVQKVQASNAGHALRGAAKSALLSGLQNDKMDPRQWRRLVMAHDGSKQASSFVAALDLEGSAQQGVALSPKALQKLSVLAQVADHWEGALRIAALSNRLSTASASGDRQAVGLSRRATLHVYRVLLQAGKTREAMRTVQQHATAPSSSKLSPTRQRAEKDAFQSLIRELAMIDDAVSLKALLETLTGSQGNAAQPHADNAVCAALGPSIALEVATEATLAMLRLPVASCSRMERAAAVLRLASIAPDGALPPVVRALWDPSVGQGGGLQQASPPHAVLPKRLIAALDATATALAFRSWCTVSSPIALLDCPIRWVADELRDVCQRYEHQRLSHAHPTQRLGTVVDAQRAGAETDIDGGRVGVKAWHALAAVVWLRSPKRSRKLCGGVLLQQGGGGGGDVRSIDAQLQRLSRTIVTDALHDPESSRRAAHFLLGHRSVAKRLCITRTDAVLHLLLDQTNKGRASLLLPNPSNLLNPDAPPETRRRTIKQAAIFRRMYAELLLRSCPLYRPAGLSALHSDPYRFLPLIQAGLAVGVLHRSHGGAMQPRSAASYRRVQRALVEATSAILVSRTLRRIDKHAVMTDVVAELVQGESGDHNPSVQSLLADLPTATVVGLGSALHEAGLPFTDVRKLMVHAAGNGDALRQGGEGLLDLVRLCSRRHYAAVGLRSSKASSTSVAQFPLYQEPSRSAMLALQSVMRRVCREGGPQAPQALATLFHHFLVDPPSLRYVMHDGGNEPPAHSVHRNFMSPAAVSGSDTATTTAEVSSRGGFAPSSIEESVRCMHTLSMLANLSDAAVLKQALTALHALAPSGAMALLRAEGLV